MHQPMKRLSRAQEKTVHGVRGVLEGLSLLSRAHRAWGELASGACAWVEQMGERSGQGPSKGVQVPRRRPGLLPCPPGHSCPLTARDM